MSCRWFRVLTLLGVLSAVLPGAAYARQFDPGALSLKLNQGMTMQQVISALGYRPNSAEQDTCGTSTPQPWPCRIWIFGNVYSQLRVYFANVNGVWMVNNWSSW